MKSDFQVLEDAQDGIGSVGQVLTEIECVTVLVADDTLKKGVVTSRGSGYNIGHVDVLPRSFDRLHIQDEGMLQEDIKEVPTVRRGNRASMAVYDTGSMQI